MTRPADGSLRHNSTQTACKSYITELFSRAVLVRLPHSQSYSDASVGHATQRGSSSHLIELPVFRDDLSPSMAVQCTALPSICTTLCCYNACSFSLVITRQCSGWALVSTTSSTTESPTSRALRLPRESSNSDELARSLAVRGRGQNS